MYQLTHTVSHPTVMFVERSDTALIQSAMDAGVPAYLVWSTA